MAPRIQVRWLGTSFSNVNIIFYKNTELKHLFYHQSPLQSASTAAEKTHAHLPLHYSGVLVFEDLTLLDKAQVLIHWLTHSRMLLRVHKQPNEPLQYLLRR